MPGRGLFLLDLNDDNSFSFSWAFSIPRKVALQNGIYVGSHQELLAKEGGLYKMLWEMQVGGFLA